MKTRILLQHSGRDQFGDPGEPFGDYRSPGLSRGEKAEYHRTVTVFVERYGRQWAGFCAGKTSAEIWQGLFPRGKPALSTFDKQRRAFISLEEFCKYALVLYRWYALMALGYSHTQVRTILARYEALDRFFIEPQVGARKPGRSPGYVARRY